jgi:hypothetical protein
VTPFLGLRCSAHATNMASSLDSGADTGSVWRPCVNGLLRLFRRVREWRHKPAKPEDALLRDAEFRILLSEFRYPPMSIYRCSVPEGRSSQSSVVAERGLADRPHSSTGPATQAVEPTAQSAARPSSNRGLTLRSFCRVRSCLPDHDGVPRGPLRTKRRARQA